VLLQPGKRCIAFIADALQNFAQKSDPSACVPFPQMCKHLILIGVRRWSCRAQRVVRITVNIPGAGLSK
jgi:hypothetical protein